jgi:hypothetical protein
MRQVIIRVELESTVASPTIQITVDLLDAGVPHPCMKLLIIKTELAPLQREWLDNQYLAVLVNHGLLVAHHVPLVVSPAPDTAVLLEGAGDDALTANCFTELPSRST